MNLTKKMQDDLKAFLDRLAKNNVTINSQPMQFTVTGPSFCHIFKMSEQRQATEIELYPGFNLTVTDAPVPTKEFEQPEITCLLEFFDNLQSRLGISTSWQEMDNKDIRFRFTGTTFSSIYTIAPSGDCAWQNAHFHKEARERWYLLFGNQIFAEESDEPLIKVMYTGDIV